MIPYPKGLPLPLREGYGFEPVSPLLRSPKMSGRAVQRRLYSSVPTVASVTWLFSASQAQLFEGWFDHVLVSGSSWFECQLKTPLGLDDYQARFTDIFNGPVLVGVDRWRYTANLELFKRPVVDAEWILFAPEYVLYSNIVDLAANREWPEA